MLKYIYIYLTLHFGLKFDAYFLLYGIISPFLAINSEQGLCSPDMIFGLATHSFKGKDRRICLPPRQRCHDSPTKHIPLSLWVTATAYYAFRALCGIIASLSFLTQFRSFQNPKVVVVVVWRGSQYHMPMSLNLLTSPVRKKCTHTERSFGNSKNTSSFRQ